MDRTSLLDALRALAPAPFERHLPHETLDALHETVVQLGLAGSRDALLARIDPALVAGLPDGPSRAAQLATDLAAMNGVERLTDGTVPLRTWVENARRLSSVRGEARVFAEALAELPVHASVKGGRATEALVAVEAVVSIGRLPRTGGDLFGREKELAWLDRCWADGAHVVTIVAWGGVGKSALVNGWLRGMAADGWRGAERVYAWSFYSQGTTDRMVSADEFISAALSEFGDNDPTAGSPWDKGE
ncbi:MAG: hypothetical protein ABI193_03890, partial [Minicystis sp.]